MNKSEPQPEMEYAEVRETQTLELSEWVEAWSYRATRTARMVRKLPDGEWRVSADETVRVGPEIRQTIEGVWVTKNAGSHEDGLVERESTLIPWSRVKSIKVVRVRVDAA